MGKSLGQRMILRHRRCGFEWTTRRYARVMFSFAPREWWDDEQVCCRRHGHKGQHESDRGFKHDG